MATKKTVQLFPNLIETIKERGLTIQSTAKSVGLTYRQLYGRLTGEIEFQLSEAIKLSKKLGVTTDYLFISDPSIKNKRIISDKQKNDKDRLVDSINQLLNEFIENCNKKQ